MLIHIFSKIIKVSLTVQSFRTDASLIFNIPKENKLYICSKFHENIYYRFKVIEWARNVNRQTDGRREGTP